MVFASGNRCQRFLLGGVSVFSFARFIAQRRLFFLRVLLAATLFCCENAAEISAAEMSFKTRLLLCRRRSFVTCHVANLFACCDFHLRLLAMYPALNLVFLLMIEAVLFVFRLAA